MLDGAFGAGFGAGFVSLPVSELEPVLGPGSEKMG